MFPKNKKFGISGCEPLVPNFFDLMDHMINGQITRFQDVPWSR